MYPENPEETQVIVGSMNMGYISDTARNWTHNLFRPKREPIPLGHSDNFSVKFASSIEISDKEQCDDMEPPHRRTVEVRSNDSREAHWWGLMTWVQVDSGVNSSFTARVSDIILSIIKTLKLQWNRFDWQGMNWNSFWNPELFNRAELKRFCSILYCDYQICIVIIRFVLWLSDLYCIVLNTSWIGPWC